MNALKKGSGSFAGLSSNNDVLLATESTTRMLSLEGDHHCDRKYMSLWTHKAAKFIKMVTLPFIDCPFSLLSSVSLTLHHLPLSPITMLISNFFLLFATQLVSLFHFLFCFKIAHFAGNWFKTMFCSPQLLSVGCLAAIDASIVRSSPSLFIVHLLN